MKTYTIGDVGLETIEFKADGDGRYALVHRRKDPNEQLGDDVRVIIMNEIEIAKLHEALSEEILKL